jgi:hypothetical protein
VLFDDGGWALLALRAPWQHVQPGVSNLVVLVVASGAVFGLVPLSALLTSISHATPDMRAPRARHLAPYIVATFPTLLYLLALGTALELALLGLSMWAFGATREALQPKYGDSRADQIAVLAGLGALLVTSVVSVVHDLARAAAARFRGTTWRSVRAALVTMRRGFFRVWWSWAWRALASALLVVVVAWLVPRFGSHSSTTKGVLVIAIIHQTVALARSGLRASWLARALRAVDALKKV